MRVEGRQNYPIIIFVEKQASPDFSGYKQSQIPALAQQLQADNLRFNAQPPRTKAIAIPMPTLWQQVKTWGKSIWESLLGK